jgi:DNA repair protein RecO (recombination protein O)
MALLVTEAVVLHAFDYLESSRIVRLATREAGVQSVIARGARRSRSRYGTSLDLFASGTAELQVKDGRELQSLTSFDATKPRAGISLALERVTAASALAELMLRFAGGDAGEALFDALERALDDICFATGAATCDVTLGGAWHVIAQLGFAPSIDACASCDAELVADVSARFSHPAGGVLCERCAAGGGGSRSLPASARDALRAWLAGGAASLSSDAERKAHQRLLREFLGEHLTDGRPLVAYELWARDGWGAVRA